MTLSRSNLEKATSYLHYTNPDRTAGRRTAIAMSRIHAYFRAARLHARKIEDFQRKAIPKKPSYSANLIQAYTFAHLYFICWAAILRMIRVIKNDSHMQTPNKLYKRHRKILEDYSHARDHFEHYDERLPGGKKSKELDNPSDFGNLQAGYFSLGGYRWDVSEKSLQRLETIVAMLSAGICQEGRERAKERLAAKLSMKA
jgi:hypothetical protein